MSDELLRQPAREAARNLMRRLLNHAAAAARRLTSDDPEAIHDFRVALRRLRANVDSFRELLENAASKKIRRRLRRLARDTNASRDAEAGLALLSSVTVPAAGRAVQHALARELQRTAARGQARREQVREEFDELKELIEARLERIRPLSVDPDFRRLWHERVKKRTKRLARDLAKVRTIHDTDAIHRARISEKALRYLVEPVKNGFAGDDPFLNSLKTLQKQLGDLHDLQVLEGFLGGHLVKAGSSRSAGRRLEGYLAVERVLLRREDDLFQSFQRKQPALLRSLREKK